MHLHSQIYTYLSAYINLHSQRQTNIQMNRQIETQTDK